MRIYFSLGYGLLCKWYMDGLPSPALWVRDHMVRYCWVSDIYLGNGDTERDITRVKVYRGLKRL